MIAGMILAIAAVVGIVISFHHTQRTTAVMNGKRFTNRTWIPKGVGMLLIVAHFSELLNAVEHLSVVHVAIALFLLAAWKAGTSSGPDTELY